MKRNALIFLCAVTLIGGGLFSFIRPQSASITTINSVGRNPLLEKPPTPDKDRLLSSFLRQKGLYGLEGHRYFTYDNGSVAIYVIYDEIPALLTKEEIAMFAPVKRGGKTAYVYSFGVQAPNEIPPRDEPQTLVYRGEPQPTTVEAVARMLKEKRVVFFTGAGISASAGVHTISSLYSDLGLDNSVVVDAFVVDAIHRPEVIVAKVLAFYCAARVSTPTRAHAALACLAMDKQAQILTGNFDLLHERSGVVPYRVYCDHSDDALAAENLRGVDMILSMGMAQDICGVLKKYKEENPNGVVVSINRSKPSFLGEGDFILCGDVQELLPAILNLYTRM